MNDFLNSLIKQGAEIQLVREELRAARIKKINSGKIPANTSTRGNELTVLISFGDMLRHSEIESKDNVGLRARYSTFIRAFAEENVYACKALAKKHYVEVFQEDGGEIEDFPFPDEEQIVDRVVDEMEKLLFGSESHRLLSRTFFEEQGYDYDQLLVTEGVFVEICLILVFVMEGDREDWSYSGRSFVTAGKWIQPERGVEHFTRELYLGFQ